MTAVSLEACPACLEIDEIRESRKSVAIGGSSENGVQVWAGLLSDGVESLS